MSNERLRVGAIIRDSVTTPTRVLVARRRAFGRWEFPSGYVESAETATQALQRTLSEELGIGISVRGELKPPGDVWPVSDTSSLRLFYARKGKGQQPSLGRAHPGLMWASSADLAALDWAPGFREPANLVAAALLDPVKKYWVYVVKLDASAYPDAGLGAFYVGETGKTPGERFADHQAGRNGSADVRRHGLELMSEMFEGPFEHEEEALEMEAEKAAELRRQGYFVPANHGVRPRIQKKV